MLKKLKELDRLILLLTLILTVIGLIMIFSASSYHAIANGLSAHNFMLRQLMFVLIAFVGGFIVYIWPHEKLKKSSLIRGLIAITVGLLVFVLLFTEPINGARAWINLGPINIQPAEIAKFTIIYYLADVLSGKQKKIRESFFHATIIPLGVIGIMLGLMALQPDMGTVTIISGITFIMLMSCGIKPSKSIGLTLLAGLGVAAAFFIMINFGDRLPFVQAYQIERFIAFVEPFENFEGSGHQVVMSLYAFARGGFWGVGLGNSVQKTGYLPEAHTDFIMAIIGEELGLFLLLAILAIYFLLVLTLYRRSIQASEPFNSLVLAGVASMLFIQAVVNLGGVVGLLPITGVTFPFISYGGSSYIVTFASICLALNCIRDEKKIRRQRKELQQENVSETN